VRGDDEEVVISRTIADEVLKGEKSLLLEDISKVDRFAEVESVVATRPRSVICAPLFREGKTSGLLYLDTQGGVGAFSDADLRVLTTLGLLAAVGLQQASLRDLIVQERRKRTRLERYHSPHVVDRILRQGTTLGDEMVAEEREVTVLFADLHQFTSLSEDLPPAKVAGVLNAVFERLTDVVFRFEATLDKFMGDGLMAIFGAPLTQPDHADRAVAAALAMREEIRRLNDHLDLQQPLEMRFGINTGSVVAGDIGAPTRRDYTVIGDVVNVASRLESMVARPGQIVIGSRTRELLTGDVECSPMGAVTVKGRDEPIHPFLVVEAVEGVTTAETEAVSGDGRGPS
jgi:adenylate cyclase